MYSVIKLWPYLRNNSYVGCTACGSQEMETSPTYGGCTSRLIIISVSLGPSDIVVPMSQSHGLGRRGNKYIYFHISDNIFSLEY
jgi:hypothetical protein